MTVEATSIRSLFKQDISRNINGVIKVGQSDEESVKQELAEYVITRELDKHFHTFYDFYVSSLESPTDKTGIWISGFFGSGKSHFLKILSYLLENRSVSGRSAISFLESKVQDEMLRANIARAAREPSDVILFNIDSKADASSKGTKDAVVRVLMKVFDEMQGYFGEVPHIAQMERQLDKDGHYASFKAAFERNAGSPWVAERDGWMFHQDDIVAALEEAAGLSREAATRLLELQEAAYQLSVERFARIVDEYLDRKGPSHRVLFLVDEVGQYVGDDSDLMLNLQTVAEDLGTYCGDRAWLIVTSQEDIDSIINSRIKGNDFSKIQGRFNPRNRIALSSANTDEVIKLRLLEKTDAAQASLEAFYASHDATLRNLISFSENNAEMPVYTTPQVFVETYPFVPYQFTLLQKVFTAVRTTGASGKHLAEGERSMLDSFQVAAESLSDRPIGALAPFHLFYRSIEGFLDATVKRVIDQAKDNTRLDAFDVDLLSTLFMIRHVKEARANVENLTTLSLSSVDEDKVTLRERIGGSLKRLERETLIQRTGEEYYFLTNEEQDISREIKNTDIDDREVIDAMNEMLWNEIYPDKKFRYSTQHQYEVNRKIDDLAYGSQTHDLALNVATPYSDRYPELSEDSVAVAETMGTTEALVRLPNDPRLVDDVIEIVRTEKYIRRKRSGSLPSSVNSILQARAEESRSRKERTRQLFSDLIAEASVFASGARVEVQSRDPRAVLNEGLRSLVGNVYTKLGYVEKSYASEAEVEALLSRQEQTLDTSPESVNHLAIEDMGQWLKEQDQFQRKVTMRSLLEQFTNRPYGWSELDTLGVLAELLVRRDVEVRHQQTRTDPRQRGFIQRLRAKRKQEEYVLKPVERVSERDIQLARDLARDYFDQVNIPQNGEQLFAFFQEKLRTRQEDMGIQLAEAESKGYPCLSELRSGSALLSDLLRADSPAPFFRLLREREQDFEDHIDDYSIVAGFFGGQAAVFDKARTDLQVLDHDLRHVSDPGLLQKVERAKEILAMPSPYQFIYELPTLLDAVQQQLATLLDARKRDMRERTASLRHQLVETAGTELPAEDRERILHPLGELERDVDRATTIDAVMARGAELAPLEHQLQNELIERIDELSKGTSGASEGDGSRPAPRRIAAVSPANLLSKTILDSEEDVEEFVNKLRAHLLSQVKDNRIRIQ